MSRVRKMFGCKVVLSKSMPKDSIVVFGGAQKQGESDADYLRRHGVITGIATKERKPRWTKRSQS
jgi:hypothetical protein